MRQNAANLKTAVDELRMRRARPQRGLDKEQLPFCSAEWRKFLENVCGLWKCVVRYKKKKTKNASHKHNSYTSYRLQDYIEDYVDYIYKSPGRKRNKAVVYFIEHGAVGDWKTAFFGATLEVQICLLLFCEVEDK